MGRAARSDTRPAAQVLDRRRRDRRQPRRPAAAARHLPAAARRERHPRPRMLGRDRRARRRRHGWNVGDGCARCSPAVATPRRSPSRPPSCCRFPRASTCGSAASLPEVACTVWSNLVMRVRPATPARCCSCTAAAAASAPTRSRSARRSARASPSPRARRTSSSRCRELGADILINYRDSRLRSRSLARSHRRPRRRRDPRQHGCVVPRVATSTRSPRTVTLVIIGMQGGRKGEVDIAKLLAKRGTE